RTGRETVGLVVFAFLILRSLTLPVRLVLWTELLPGVAAVARDVKSAAGAAAAEFPRPSASLPHAGENDARVVRIDGDVGCAGVGVFEEHAIPGLAAVLGSIYPAFAVRAESVAEDRGEGDVRVARMDGHCADLTDLLPDVLPGLARVGALVDPVSGGDVAANVRFTAADVDHVRIGRSDGE